MSLSTNCSMIAFVCLSALLAAGEQPDATKGALPRMATDHLANWIDGRFAVAWQESKIVPTEVVDDAAFLKRTHLDLTGSIPSVSEARDYLESDESASARDAGGSAAQSRPRPFAPRMEPSITPPHFSAAPRRIFLAIKRRAKPSPIGWFRAITRCSRPRS